MVSRIVRIGLVGLGIVLTSAAPVLASPAPVPSTPTAPTTPTPPPPPVADVDDAADSLVPVPAGCTVPAPADVAFVGTVLDKDGFIEKGTVRFSIDQLRAGNAGPFSVNGVVDVRYGPDSKYLEIGEAYLVGASVDPVIGSLASKISPAAPLFGGDAVISLEDTEVECPILDDPVQTLNVDGSTVESGLLSPMFEDRSLLLATVGVPAAVVGAALLALVLLRRALTLGVAGIFRLGREAVTPRPDVRASRVRTHRPRDAEHESDDELVASR